MNGTEIVGVTFFTLGAMALIVSFAALLDRWWR
jgi:hypothetical protein